MPIGQVDHDDRQLEAGVFASHVSGGSREEASSLFLVHAVTRRPEKYFL